jgi:large subunit ribosomal protein L25
MQEIPISVERRPEIGKGFARRARMAGKIPAVIYGPEIDPIPVAVEERSFRASMKTSTSSSILNLNLEGKETKAVVRDLQRDPITNRVVHIDFHAISMNRPINVSIPIQLNGIPLGVKVDGGIMQTTMRELEISCLPANIPDIIELDVSELSIGESIHVSDIELENVTILTELRRTVVVISAPTVIKADDVVEDEEAEGEEGEAVEGAEGAPAEGEAEKKDEAKPDEGKK